MRLLRPLSLILASLALGSLAPWRPESESGPGRAGSQTSLRWEDPRDRDPTCHPPRQVPRTFVGFEDGRDLPGDYAPAAIEATRILKVATSESCKLNSRQDASGTLHGALQSKS